MRAFTVWEPDELPHLRDASAYYADAEAMTDWRTVHRHQIAEFERRYGKH